jgi:hypothetical protein
MSKCLRHLQNQSALGRRRASPEWLCAQVICRAKGESHETPPRIARAKCRAANFPSGPCADIDWKKVDIALGKTAAVSGEVHRYGMRSDLHVTLDGIAIKPAFALGGWVAIAPMHGEATVMGDLVLLETEITPVMTKLMDSGF